MTLRTGTGALVGTWRRAGVWLPAALVLAAPLVAPPSGRPTVFAVVGWLLLALMIVALSAALRPTAAGLFASILRFLLRAPTPAVARPGVGPRPVALLPRCRDPRAPSGHRPRAPGHHD